MSTEMNESVKRWTARRKMALVLDIIQGNHLSGFVGPFQFRNNGSGCLTALPSIEIFKR